MKKLLELVQKGYLYAALCLIAGLMLVIWPGQTVWGVYFTAAAAVMALGGVRIFRYFRSDALEGHRRLTFASGAVLILTGLMLILYRGNLSGMLPQLIGFALLALLCIRAQGALDMLRRSFARWWWALILAGVFLVCAVLCLTAEFSLNAKLILAGACLLLEGAASILSSLWFSKTDRPGKNGKGEIRPANYTYTWTAEEEKPAAEEDAEEGTEAAE